MRSKGLEIYSYVVTGICLFLIIIFAGAFIKDVVGFINPEFALSASQVRKYGHNDNYRRSMKDAVNFENEEDVTRHREEARKVALVAAKHGALRNIIKFAPALVLFAIIGIVHWKLAGRQRRRSDNNDESKRHSKQ